MGKIKVNDQWFPIDGDEPTDAERREIERALTAMEGGPAEAMTVPVGGDTDLEAIGDTAAIGLSGMEAGLSRGFNPVRQIGNYAALAQAVLPEPFKNVMGVKPLAHLSRLAAKYRKHTTGRDTALGMPFGRMLGRAVQGVTGRSIADLPRTPEATAKARGAEMTGLRRILAKTGEVTGEILPAAGLFAAAGVPFGAQAAYAALSGFGSGLGREVGGKTGEMIGGLAPLGLAGAAAPIIALSRWAGRAAAPLTGSGQDRTALQIVRELTGGGPVTAKPSPIPGAPLTLGQRTGIPKVLDAELTLRSKAPGFEAAAMEVGRRVSKEMSGIGPRVGSRAVRKKLTTAFKKEKAEAGGAFGRGMENIGKETIPVRELRKTVREYTDTLTDAERRMLPGKVMSLLRKQYGKKMRHLGGLRNPDGSIKRIPKPVSFDELQGIKSLLGDTMGKIDVGSNARRVMGGLKEKLDDLAAFRSPEYMQARAQYAKFKKRFEKDPELGKLFKRNPDGSFRIEPSKAGEQLLRMTDEALMRAAKIPGVKEAGRDYLSAAWAERASRSGDTTLAAARNFFRDNEGAFRAFYRPKDARRALRIMDTLEMRDQAGIGLRRFGSPTQEKLAKSSLIDGLIGRGIGRVPGGGLVNRFIGSLYDKPRIEIDLKLAEMLLNPDSTIARLAMMPATRQNAARLQRAWLAPISATPAGRGMQAE